MYGWRARIGAVSATPTEMLAYEFYQIAPTGVSLLSAVLDIGAVRGEELRRAEGQMEAAVASLAREGAQVVVLGAAPVVFTQDPGADRNLAERLARSVQIPVLSNQTAMMDALRSFGARRLAVASPFTPEVEARLGRFLAGNGFEVAAMQSLGLSRNAEISRVPSADIYALARRAAAMAPEAEAVLMPCANWTSTEVVDALEADLGLPVVTSNLAKIWAGLRAAGVGEVGRAVGRLLAERLVDPPHAAP